MTDPRTPRFRSSLTGPQATRPEPVAPDEEAFEETLRPRTLEEFAGQEKLKRNLRISIAAARQRGEPLGHCLFSGPPGLGKTTLAHILAHEMGGKIRVTSGPVLEKPVRSADELALHVLSRLTPERFVAAIRRQDLATLTGISGVGKKTAERLVLELKDKVGEFADSDVEEGEPVQLTTNGEDAVKALIALGIGRTAAERAVQASLSAAPDAPAADLTRRALSSIRE